MTRLRNFLKGVLRSESENRSNIRLRGRAEEKATLPRMEGNSITKKQNGLINTKRQKFAQL